MALPSRPRFYALIWGQSIGLLIINGGMLPYWLAPYLLDYQYAIVPRTITYRVIVICIVVLLTVLLPIYKNSAGGIVKGLGTNVVENREPLADNPSAVRNLLWGCMYADFLLLTYLVHITGGIAGSMFAGIYLLLPSIPLLLRLDQVDVRRTRWLAVVCAAGIFGSFFMSHYHYYEFNAEHFEHAYDLAVTAVTIAALSLPVVEIAVLRQHEETEEQREESGGGTGG